MAYHINSLCEDSCDAQLETGEWVRARPINYRAMTVFERLKDAWMVFTGKADAVVWTEQ